MPTLVSYQLTDKIATITLDDGKANVISPQVLAELNAAFDKAEADRAIVVLTGRSGLLSGGFDLAVLGSSATNAMNLVKGGFEFASRLMTYPRPVIIACNGHAIAMGVFLLLSADYRIGTEGAFKIVANEVAIGMTMPRPAIEICRARLTPAHFNRAMLLAEVYSPADAVTAGFLDRVVPAADLLGEAMTVARQFLKLNMQAHAGTKARIRGPLARAVREGMDADLAEVMRPA